MLQPDAPRRPRAAVWLAHDPPARAAQVAGLCVAAIGAAALAGWATGSVVLRAGRAGYISVAPITAALFLLLGASVAAIPTAARAAQLFARCAVTLALAVATTRLAEYFTGLELGIGHRAFAVPPEHVGLEHGRKMAFYTALSFVLASLALLSQTLRRRPRSQARYTDDLAKVAALAVALIGFVFTLGYLYDAPLLYGDGSIPMALPSAVGFLVLGLAMIVPTTFRDRAQQRERERTHAQIDGAFEHTVIGAALVAPDGRWLRVNRALCEIVGYTESELLATNFQAITHPADIESDLALVRQMLAGEIRSYHKEKRYLHKQGHDVWILLTVSLVRDPDGSPLYFIGQIQDIGERKRGEAALTRQALVFETISDAVIVMDLAGRVTDWNPAAERIFGYTKQEMLGHDVERIHHPRLGGALERAIRAGLARDDRWAGELPFVRKDGTEGVADVIVVVQRDAAGAATAWVGVNRDITERKRAEAALRESEDNQRLLVESVRDYAIFRLDRSGHVASWNVGAERIKGYSEREILGQHFSVFYTPEDVAAGEPARLLATAAAGRVESEGWRLRKDGSRFRANVVMTALRDRAGELVGFGKVTRDVTEQNRLEEQLRQSQKLEAVGQLAGGVAHDFNNLLLVVKAHAQFALEDLGTAHPQAEDVRTIRDAAERAAVLTRQLLAFSRRQVLEPRVLSLNALVTQFEKMVRRVLPADIALVTTLAPDLAAIEADPGQLEQVLMNLVVNARDAMRDGGTITIETANEELEHPSAAHHGPMEIAPGSYVALFVSDTGAGMDEATQARIFEPFFTTKERGHGTGLGLSTVYGIVKQSGGYVWVSSEPGHGTTFRVYLPRASADVAEARRTSEPGTPRRGTETVLVVDDDPLVRAVAVRVLTKSGYRVLEACDGVEALRISATAPEPIHLVLADLVMPEMGGRALAAELRTRHVESRILFMSGYTEDAALRRSILEPGEAFLPKPFTPGALASKVREVLDEPAVTSPVAPPADAYRGPGGRAPESAGK